ncbi:hypothetical protein evm_011806 [Chilo suppressalis]|nr:hypothetical protein evm_011806 [Chilo suppressalis]
MVWSFGGVVRSAVGRGVRLRCGGAGPALTRAWARRRPAPPLQADPRYLLDGDYLHILSQYYRPALLARRRLPAHPQLVLPTRATCSTATTCTSSVSITDPRYLLDGDYLHILSVDRSVSDNYTCTVRNAYGSERVTWEVIALTAPPRPLLRLTAAAPAALTLAWAAPAPAVAGLRERVTREVIALTAPPRPLLRLTAAAPAALTLAWAAPAPAVAGLRGYTLEHTRADTPSWISTRLTADSRGHTLERLACGTVYKVRLFAYNAVGASPPSDELLVSTKGGPSRAAPEKVLITTNSTCVTLNLLTWDSNGCPLSPFTVSVRGFEESAGRSLTVPPAAQPTPVCGLLPATWYHLKVVANTAAGTTMGNYYFATLTEEGERIPAPAQFPPRGGAGSDTAGGAGALLAGAAAALLAALLLLAALAYRRSVVSAAKGRASSGRRCCATGRFAVTGRASI